MPLTGMIALGAMAAAMVGSIFSSDAWNNITFIAGEVKNPQRNIGLSLFFGTLIVTIIYVMANLMYLAVLPIEQLAFAKDNRIAVSVSNEIFGVSGAIILAGKCREFDPHRPLSFLNPTSSPGSWVFRISGARYARARFRAVRGLPGERA